MSKTCLIVDDASVIRKVSRHILESLGFEVSDAAGADEYVMKPFDHETLQIKLQIVGFD